MKNLITLCAIIFLSTTLFSQQSLDDGTDYDDVKFNLHVTPHYTDMVSNKHKHGTGLKIPIKSIIEFEYDSNFNTIVEISSRGIKNSFIVEGFEYKKKDKRGYFLYKSIAYDDLDLEYKMTLAVGKNPIELKKITIENTESGESIVYY